MGSALLDEIDTGLRFRAASLMSTPQAAVAEHLQPALEEADESFDQLLTRDGQVLRVTPGVPTSALLPPDRLRRLDAPTFLRERVPGVADQSRLLAVPLSGVDRGKVLVVGATMSDRTDALHLLTLVLVAGGALAGWFTAGLALSPMERIRRQASAITASGLDRRLELPRAHDEVRRLAETLNDLLQRLDEALAGERTFLERASHELRTPLSALKAELDLARSRPRSPQELTAALASAAEETDRLVRLANDLLVMARAHDGELPMHRDDTDLRELVESATGLFASQSAGTGHELSCSVPDRVVRIDGMRVRQALDNLIDNALRHTPCGSRVDVVAAVDEDRLLISVADTGDGFDPTADDGRGLGLRIAQSVAAGHGGRLDVSRTMDGGALVVLVLADV
jgi:signal transduction histidine kinase